MKKILLVFGTRPEAIKMAPIIEQLKKTAPEIKTLVCVTAQHREMLDQVLRIFKITPDYDLDLMKKDQDLFDITANSLIRLKDVIKKESPDLIMVQGDTTTAFTAGLAAYYSKIPLAHVEAGLRTHNKYSPFPEEKNRHLLSTLADLHFAPTGWSRDNLLKEGVPEEKIIVTGNTVVDALFTIVKKQTEENSQGNFKEYFLKKWALNLASPEETGKIILVTGHRRENFGEGFENICLALKEIAEKRREVKIVYPVHLNPHVQEPVKNILQGQSNVFLIDPLEYEPFIFLMQKVYLVLTDSGGIQEEAPSLGKPVLVMRNTTERPEGVQSGTVKLVGTDRENIFEETIDLLDNREKYLKMSQAVNPYGDGQSSARIIEAVKRFLF